ncbi:MAG: uroporphyrinogen-III C-methyltransferase, partial [Deltaproteobacteria bacterium]|nr:uroporphyrinogen-III C-methyltransferase [Deltaproteobacteria bacterium]
EFARRDAECIYVGKAADRHTLPQEEINALLVRLGQEGKQVVRLKGGDPYVFGRGGEEAEALSEAGVPFQVVPGITAAIGCAAATGIPLTHRDSAQSLLLVTGHLKDNTMDLNWRALAQPGQTLAVYMGLGGLEILCRELQAHGLPASTPAACIEKGTTARQRLRTGTLETLPAKVREAQFATPTLILVGDVVAHRREPALREYWQTLDAAMNG